MFDREAAVKAFRAYTAGYDPENTMIRLKIEHTFRVAYLCGRIAGLLYPQLEAGAVSEAAIIAQFPDSADEREAAGIFHTKVPAKNGAELDRAVTDTVIRMLKSSNDAYLLNADITDMNVYGRYIENKKKLEQFEKGSLLHLPWQES